MIEVPKRSTLIDQTAEALRRNLHLAEWAQGLPPERVLSDHLQVSRPTLRLALKTLEREGLVRLSKSPRCWIRVESAPARPADKPKLVQFLTCDEFADLSPSHLVHLYQLRRHLHDAGIGLEVLGEPRLKRGSPNRLLEDLARRVNPSCWVLQHSTAAMQRWFFQQSLPVIIKGTCYAGLKLPSIDVDYRAMTHHAVGLFIRKGHRRIALLLPRDHGAGELQREEGFRQAFTTFTTHGVEPRVLHHDGTFENIQSVLRIALQAKAPPTGLLVSESLHALNVLTLLLAWHVRVPEDVSLVCCDDEVFMDRVTPRIARYRIEQNTYTKRLSRMVAQLASTGVLSTRPVRVIPPFQSGDTLAPPSAK